MTKNEFIKIAENAGFDWACQELRSENDDCDLESEESLVEYAKYCIDNGNYADALDVIEALNKARFGCSWFRCEFCGTPYAVEDIEDIEDLLGEGDDEEE